jgi:hypothetical protein
VATIVQKKLRQAGPGVTVQGKDGSEEDVQLQGHVTLMKTSHFTGKQRAALGKADKNLAPYAERWKDYDFGWETASILHLCAMKTRAKGGVAGGGEGGYVVDGIVHLPPAFGRLPSVVSWSDVKVQHTSSGAAGACPGEDAAAPTSAPGGADERPDSHDVTTPARDPGVSNAVTVKVKFSYDGAKTGVVAVGIEVEGDRHQSVWESGSEKTADASHLRPKPRCAATEELSTSTDGKLPLPRRNKIAEAIEAALLSCYSYRVEEDWSESLEELATIQGTLAAQLEATGSALVTYAHTPPCRDTVMTVDIHMSCSTAVTPAGTTKQWAEGVEQGWQAAREASRAV